jgi:hypothetical protein
MTMIDTPRFAVVKGQRPEDVAGEMANRIKELIWEYEGRCVLATAIGVLHIVANELLEDARG